MCNTLKTFNAKTPSIDITQDIQKQIFGLK